MHSKCLRYNYSSFKFGLIFRISISYFTYNTLDKEVNLTLNYEILLKTPKIVGVKKIYYFFFILKVNINMQ